VTYRNTELNIQHSDSDVA